MRIIIIVAVFLRICVSLKWSGVGLSFCALESLGAARPAAGLAPATANAWGSPAAVASLCAGGRPPSAGLRFAHLDRQDSAAAAA